MINTPATYKYDNNRLMIIDWSSIAHQNIHSIEASYKTGDDYGIQTRKTNSDCGVTRWSPR